MSTITATIVLNPDVAETFTAAELPGVGGTVLNYTQLKQTKRLTASSTPPATKVYGEKITSSTALDLTALVRSIGGTIDTTGLKLQYLHLENLSAANTVTVADGDANAYQIAAGQSIVVPAGGFLALFFNDKLADVDATHKAIKFTATAGQSYDLLLVFG